MDSPELSERLLNDAGGWQTMRQARALYEMGRVSGAVWNPPLLQGLVREGQSEFKSGLRIESRTRIDNLCSCRDSRQRGAICAHSVAVGLEVLKPRALQATPAPAAATPAKPKVVAPALPEFSLEQGEPIELFVILPPNLAAAWEKGTVMAGLEARVGVKRMLLSALPKNGRYRGSESDLRIISAIRELAGELPGMAMLSRPQFAAFLPTLAGHPHTTLGKSTTFQINGEPLLPPLAIIHADNGDVRLSVTLPPGAAPLLGAAQPWVIAGAEMRPLAPALPSIYHELLRNEVSIPAEQAEAFLRRELPAFRKAFTFDEPDLGPEAERPAVPAPGLALRLEGSLNHLTGRLMARYPGRADITLAQSTRPTGFARNYAAETAALDRLRHAGFSGPDGQGELVLKGESRILAFFARELPWWEKNAEVEIGARFQHVTRDIERIQPRLEIRSSGENWFDLQVELAASGGECFSAAEIQRLLQGGASHVRRKNGKLAVFDPGMLDEFQQVLQDCDPKQKQPGLYRIDQRHAAYLESSAIEQGASIDAPAEWRSWASASRQAENLRPVPLDSLEDVMRPYQKHGVYWLHFLAKNGLGGVLADEMGLGKTVQALAAIRALPGKTLVVCPSSLVYNWQREAERFTPGRRILAIEGPNRHALFGQPLKDADLVITSYPLLRRDAERYRGTTFTTAVLDEAQHIKNPDSQNAQSAFAIRAEHRFVLTGTPVENSVRDIWALMNFVMPGYLGTRNDFHERFEQPIMSSPGGPEHQRLAKRLKPFVLRRKKQDVLTELPEKIEQVTYCELSEAQKSVYAELLTATRRQVSDLAGSKDQNKARMVMLTALLRLRQACCDLRLLGSPEERAVDENSGKIGLLDELLEEAIDGQHRVLIFSQFATMLGLLRDWLNAAGIEHCHLDGSTKDRAGQVDKFQKGETPVFLISLKAGGVGLNLTAADTVVHFDPWWNPAVEAQATDRAHRIGQKKVVTAYKLITRGTVEEKILALQTKKREVIDATIESDQPMMQGLSMDDIRDLLT